MNAFIKQYLDEIKLTRAEVTHAEYSERLKRFSTYLHGREDLTRQIAVSFLLSLKEKGFGQASISLHQSTLKSFYGWLALNGYKDRNLMSVNAIESYRSPKKENARFTAQEYERLKSYCLTIQNGDQTFWHDAVIAAWNTGLRMSDIAYLERDQINVRAKKIVVIPRKTQRFGYTLEIPILPEMDDMLTRNTFTPQLFPQMAISYSKHGNKVLSVQFGRICKEAGMPGRSFHQLRHAYASRALVAGIPPGIVGSITGQTLKTMQRYLHVEFSEKQKAFEVLA